MALALLLDDDPALAPLALALELGRATLPLPARTVPGLGAAHAREHPEALLLVPAVEYAELQETHTILPDLAAVGQHGAAALLIADRRLDEVEHPIVELGGVSRMTECLARATLLKFYGITAAAWVRDADPPAPELEEGATQRLAVADGGEALHLLDEPGGRILSDLGRAWFVLTGLPAVTHLLLAPNALNDAAAAELRAFLEALPAALAATHDRRRELRRELSARYGVSRELLNTYYNDQVTSLTGDAQRSLLALFAAGAWGMDLPTVTRLKLPPGAPRA